MRHGSRPRIAALGLPLLAQLLVSANLPAERMEVKIDVTGLRSGKGMVLACMTSDPDHFPDCEGDADAYSLTVKAGEPLTLTFPAVAPGHYAIALAHDENDNGKIDRALGVIPREGFGFSRDARVRMGPPKFRDAAFDVGDTPVRQAIRMRYLL